MINDSYHPVALSDRTLISISGLDVLCFLQQIITTDIDAIGTGDMLPGALLSPQGKILFDFLIGRSNCSFFIDIHSTAADALVYKLNLYRLRANVEIQVKNYKTVCLDLRPSNDPIKDNSAQNGELIFHDRRLVKGYRSIRIYNLNNEKQFSFSAREKWDRIRIAYGIAESGTDFVLGDVFPHDINYDKIHGISFKKGCYIGQEVVSRMHHRGIVRKRVLVARGIRTLPLGGAVIEAAGKPVGRLGTVVGVKAIALVRIDHIKAMMNANTPITAHGIPLTFSSPENMHFSLCG